jgi:hypothetical protein
VTRPNDLVLSLLADHASADELAQLAAARRVTEHRPRLSAEAAAELAEMLAAGVRPALGWWRRHV